LFKLPRFEILNGGPNVAVQALDLFQLKQITVLGRLFSFPI
jgi:hypothetical protein